MKVDKEKQIILINFFKYEAYYLGNIIDFNIDNYEYIIREIAVKIIKEFLMCLY